MASLRAGCVGSLRGDYNVKAVLGVNFCIVIGRRLVWNRRSIVMCKIGIVGIGVLLMGSVVVGEAEIRVLKDVKTEEVKAKDVKKAVRVWKEGPANRGLVLGLQVVEGKDGVKAIRVRLRNTSKKAVRLIGVFTYADGKKKRGYADCLKELVSFSTVPRVEASPFSTGGLSRKAPQPTHDLGAGESMVVEREMKGDYLWGGSLTHGSYHFVRKGMYFLRAHVVVKTKERAEVKLYSNEEALVVGGLRKAPGACSARVLKYDENAGLVWLDAGSLDGVRLGDVFEVGHGKTRLWELKISKIGREYAFAKPVLKAAPRKGAENPGGGMVAKLVKTWKRGRALD